MYIRGETFTSLASLKTWEKMGSLKDQLKNVFKTIQTTDLVLVLVTQDHHRYVFVFNQLRAA